MVLIYEKIITNPGALLFITLFIFIGNTWNMTNISSANFGVGVRGKCTSN